MSKKEHELIEYHDNCIGELSHLYNNSLDKIKELEDYIELLQRIFSQYNISYPPLEKPVNF